MNPVSTAVPTLRLTAQHTLRLHIQNKGKVEYPLSELVYLQAVGNYCWLHWQDGQRMLMPRTLAYYESQLPGDLFLRLHRNSLVNRQYIDRISRSDNDRGRMLYLRSGEALPISRRRWLEVTQLLAHFSGRSASAIGSLLLFTEAYI